ncbi:MAG TPA: type II toxin-antitoxin system VapC family toxin [Thermodesulfobacteriota bacterium]|nr:type II toxin-antitoxin system VapC family toxin [Thermodesulfobacteriota bacterium]
MKLYYLDSSALVKGYVKEKGSEKVREILEDESLLATSQIAYPEVLSALARKRRDGEVKKRDFNKAINRFIKEFEALILISVDVVWKESGRAALRYILKGADSIHLESVLKAQDIIGTEAIFVVSDKELIRTAIKIGIDVFNPED